ncbi:MAG: flagellar protein export ATPase FliI [Candidatus Neomarinimicrobiota bacterium]
MQGLTTSFATFMERIPVLSPVRFDGRVSQVIGLVIEASGPLATIGDLCEISSSAGQQVRAEIVGFRGKNILLMPLDEMMGISPGSRVSLSPRPLSVPVGPQLLGRILDGLGNPIDGKGPIVTDTYQPVFNIPPDPLTRQRIAEPMPTGIRAIDGLVTVGKGQRVGIFSGSGVGKSVLLGMISRYTDAPISVIGLIGERGREVREFIEKDLGEEGLKKSVVIVATSDQAAMIRIKGALITTAIAEYFRDSGQDVMLLMDSLTRVAMAQREIGLAIGEPPTTKGYTPSVFALLPRLLERAGNSSRGSITGLYTVLVEADDMDEPISDASRSILDGHIVLSRRLATLGHYPAIDVLQSISRVKNDVTAAEQKKWARTVLELLAIYRESEDLINIGAYSKGSNPRVDLAIKHIPAFNRFLRQDILQAAQFEETLNSLKTITQGLN